MFFLGDLKGLRTATVLVRYIVDGNDVGTTKDGKMLPHTLVQHVRPA